MASSSIPSPDDITVEAFAEYLGRYPEIIAAVSEAKGGKPGQSSLLELDEFRYVTAPATFGGMGGRRRDMNRKDVLKLVEWKLRHGKFRPTLMKLVESNPSQLVQDSIQTAMGKYAGHKFSAKRSVKMLCDLKGIGPATASLLVAAHYPKQTIFFSDEAYAWLAGGPSYNPPSKYNHKEYEDLMDASWQLIQRLPEEYGAQDIEQVAFVIMYDKKNGAAAKKAAKAEKVEKDTKTEVVKGQDTNAEYIKDDATLKRKAEETPPYPIQGIDTKRRKQPLVKPAPKKVTKAAPTEAPASGSVRRSSRLQK
ncbi:hypothetical protein Sste5346_000228 [Sporothrix stenoceras]|uniref:Uncharacterized protein n=1 Tax=Sporothrix stenoceras TaxID=5173 RepID=A0ABR3ZU35_9PEZI